ncbi:MAG: hypothetical protein LBQ86_06375 [Holophagales bacterium]|jgi:DNA-damage-inducible protein J|nr:hypothetical protein [Holophagales bacterium]
MIRNDYEHEVGDMAQRTINVTVQLDEQLKNSGEELFRRLGMSFSAAFSAFVSYSVKQGKIPFEIDDGFDAELYARDPYFTREEQAELRRRIADIEAGRNCGIRELIEVEDDG